MLRSVEVLDAEGVDGNDFDTGFVTDFEHLTQVISDIFSLKTKRGSKKFLPLRALRSLDDGPLWSRSYDSSQSAYSRPSQKQYVGVSGPVARCLLTALGHS